MRHMLIFFVPMVMVGCATQQPVAETTPAPATIAAALPTKAVETRYEMRGYREAANPAVRHEAHAIYRRSRIPLNADTDLETVPRAEFAPASYTPLPASDELAAELATQKAITASLREVQAAVAETERQMQGQYATLVRQTAETLKLREELEAEREQLQAALASQAKPAEIPPASPSEVRW